MSEPAAPAAPAAPQAIPAAASIPSEPKGSSVSAPKGMKAMLEANVPTMGIPGSQSPVEAPKPETKAEVAEVKSDAPAAPETPSAEPKSPWDKLDALEVRKPAPPAEPEIPADDLHGANKKVIEFRRKYEAAEAERVKLAADLETVRATALDPESKAKLENFEKIYAVEALVASPEYQAEIAAPFSEQQEILHQVAEFSKVDASKLMEAAKDPNPLTRGQKIRTVLEESKIDNEKGLEAAATTLESAASKMHELWKKDAQKMARAQEIQNAARGEEAVKGSAKAEQARQKQEKEFSEAHESIYKTLEAKLPALFSDPEFAKIAKSAKAASDPMNNAYRAIAGESLPLIVQRLMKAEAELASIKEGNKAAAAANPRLGAAPINTDEAPKMTMREALEATMRGGMARV